MSEKSHDYLKTLILNSKPVQGIKKPFQKTVLLRRLELVHIWNQQNCQLLHFSHLAKILKVSDKTIRRDCSWLSVNRLLTPNRDRNIPFQPTENAQAYIKRFLTAHGREA
jgi:DeoR/GlpR family transcriptional regulator of sugar metabolism